MRHYSNNLIRAFYRFYPLCNQTASFKCAFEISCAFVIGLGEVPIREAVNHRHHCVKTELLLTTFEKSFTVSIKMNVRTPNDLFEILLWKSNEYIVDSEFKKKNRYLEGPGFSDSVPFWLNFLKEKKIDFFNIQFFLKNTAYMFIRQFYSTFLVVRSRV